MPRYKKNKFLDFSLDDICNALLLCKNCHTMFDFPLPAWILLPDLDFFIQFEEEDFRKREEKTKNNPSMEPEPRTCPNASQYHAACIEKNPTWPKAAIGGVYYQYWMPGTPPSPTRDQAWHGAPIAAILHATRAVNGRVSPPEFVPAEVKKQLRHLQALYEREIDLNQRGLTSESSGGVELVNPAAPNLVFTSTSDSPSAFASVSSQAIKSSTTSPPAEQPSSSFMQASSVSQRPLDPTSSQKGPTISRRDPSDAQPYLSAIHNNGKGGSKSKEYHYSHIFRWKLGPGQTTQQTIDAIVETFGKHLLLLPNLQDELTRSDNDLCAISSKRNKKMDEESGIERDEIKEIVPM